MKNVARRVGAAATAISVLVIGKCAVTVSRYERAFDAINIGDSQTAVLERFGTPGIVEVSGVLFPRYASTPCRVPCARRLWWEHPIFVGMEAWSVEVDNDRRVMQKAHWASP